jgi:acetyl esterase/lipase
MIIIPYLMSCCLLVIAIWTYRQPQSGFAWMSSLVGSVFPLFCILFLILLSSLEMTASALTPIFLAMNAFTAGLLMWPVISFLSRGDSLTKKLLEEFPLASAKRFSPSFWKLFLMQDWRTNKKHVYQVANRKGDLLTVQVYPAQDLKAPCIYQIHGGAYSRGDYKQLCNYNRFLNKLGYSVVTTSYRFIPNNPWPAQHEDVMDVFQEIANNTSKYGLNCQEFVISGRSAGGHLALLAGLRLQDPRIRGIISFYPLVDFKVFSDKGYSGDMLDTPTLVQGLLQAKPNENPAIYADINPVNFISDKAPPVLLIHGDRDSVVSLEHSLIMSSYLKAAGRRSYLLQLPYESHAFDVNLNGPGGQTSAYSVCHFLASVLQK